VENAVANMRNNVGLAGVPVLINSSAAILFLLPPKTLGGKYYG
jgi:hypothetical protein